MKPIPVVLWLISSAIVVAPGCKSRDKPSPQPAAERWTDQAPPPQSGVGIDHRPDSGVATPVLRTNIDDIRNSDLPAAPVPLKQAGDHPNIQPPSVTAGPLVTPALEYPPASNARDDTPAVRSPSIDIPPANRTGKGTEPSPIDLPDSKINARGDPPAAKPVAFPASDRHQAKPATTPSIQLWNQLGGASRAAEITLHSATIASPTPPPVRAVERELSAPVSGTWDWIDPKFHASSPDATGSTPSIEPIVSEPAATLQEAKIARRAAEADKKRAAQQRLSRSFYRAILGDDAAPSTASRQ